jgi:hypothetical protein
MKNKIDEQALTIAKHQRILRKQLDAFLWGSILKAAILDVEI